MRLDKAVMISIIVLILALIAVEAYPPLPTEFYGSIIYYNEKAPSGRAINATDPQNVNCGAFTIVSTGFFGVMSCKGDFPDTLVDEGATSGDVIRFFYRNEEAYVIGDGTYTPGTYKNITLIIPKLLCGDSFCQQTYETCASCPADCGTCITPNATTPPNATQNTSTSGGAGGGGGAVGGGGGGSGGGGGGGGGGFDLNDLFINLTQMNATPENKCKENWNCTDWSECFVNETQIRSCSDENHCNTTKNRPPEIQECIYEGTCFDFIRNGKETGIDCGGPCRPCPGHEGEPNCFDGLRNCHDGVCEEGVDCGGVCSNSCEKPKRVEQPIRICNKPSEIFRPDFLILYISIIILTIGYVFIEKEREKKIKKDEKLKDIDKARKYLAIEKNIILFIIFVILLLTSIITYYIFFFCSKNFYEFLKFAIPAVIIVPVIAFFVMHVLEYNEKERKEKLARFLNTHHEHIKKLIALQNDYLNELEVEISNEIYQVSGKQEFKDTIEKYPELKTVYRDMITLYDKYKEKKTPYGIEKELCEAIKKIEDDEAFKKLAAEHVEIKIIYDKLSTLYKAYEEKNDLYKELLKDDGKNVNAEKKQPA